MPWKTLALSFCAWKSLLFVLAALCPGPGYDTSAFVLFDSSTQRHDEFSSMSRASRFLLNLLRWDAVYFVQAAEHGKLHEQEWAFSWVYSRLLSLTGQYVFRCEECPLQCYVVAGIVISNLCHLCSAFILYHLVILIVERPERHQIALVASVLHILTPAALFLAAPYAEALFSLLNFGGILMYAQSKLHEPSRTQTLVKDALKLCSGLCFATACLIRSNGLLSGLIFLFDLVGQLASLKPASWNAQSCRRAVVTCTAGTLVLLGFIAPQYLAYLEFCVGDPHSVRPWCKKALPSIYSWVQSHYWNVGLFHYWTLSNLPLFVMATPMLWILVASSSAVLYDGLRTVTQDVKADDAISLALPVHRLPELAVPQLILALTAFTSFHVQIVNRIASGYPTWYVMLATLLVDARSKAPAAKSLGQRQWFVRGMIIYGLVQSTLFANFLPPA
ncbi:ER membrane glycoprotein subunit of the GPI transamidase complex-like protein [Coniothyrium glycines]